MRQIAEEIDLLHPPMSLRKLAGRFRYPGVAVGKLPYSGISLRELDRRVGAPAGKRLEFLHYNAYLLYDALPLVDIIRADMYGFMYTLGDEFAKKVVIEYLLEFGISELCDKLFPPIVEVCGVSVNPLNKTCKDLSLAGEAAAWLIDQFGDVFAIIFDVIEMPQEFILNAIFDVLGVPQELPLKSAGDVPERAAEIGGRLGCYDLVSLCEVWHSDHRDLLLEHAAHGNYFCGPPGPQTGDWRRMGSGILVFSPSGLPIDGPASYEYSQTGVIRWTDLGPLGGYDLGPFVDADRWSCKGVQLTLVHLEGIGTLEVYSTHLYSGGDMIEELFGKEVKPTSLEKAQVREAQIAELARFIQAHHDPGRVAIVVGDFNVAPSERDCWVPDADLKGIHRWTPGELGDRHRGLRDQLRKIEDGLEFDDWYSLDMFKDAYPSWYANKDSNGNPIPADPEDWGHTNRSGEKGFVTFDAYCPASAAAARGFPNPEPGDYYCDESFAPWSEATGNRIDYVFVQCPVAAHDYYLDVSRIRRRPFARTGSWNSEPCLSDHVGLELTLFATPK
jgi:exonuclease III